MKHSFFFSLPFFLYLSFVKIIDVQWPSMWHDSTRFHRAKKKYFSLSVERFRDLFPRQNSRWNVVTGRETCSKEAVCSNAIFFFSKRKCYTFQRPRVCWSNRGRIIKLDGHEWMKYVKNWLKKGCNPLSDICSTWRYYRWMFRKGRKLTRDAGLNAWLKMYKWRFLFFFSRVFRKLYGYISNLLLRKIKRGNILFYSIPKF